MQTPPLFPSLVGFSIATGRTEVTGRLEKLDCSISASRFRIKSREMSAATGALSLKLGSCYYALYFPHHGWLAAELVQYLEEIYAAEEPAVQILRLLGYTLEIRRESLPRAADHWVEVDLEERKLVTNSELIRKAVYQEPPEPSDPYLPATLRRLREVLDRYDFTVELVRS